MNHEQFVGIVVGLITAVVTLVLLALFDRDLGAEPVKCVDHETRERVRQLSLECYDQALRDHTARLFDIWIKDQDPEPKRASVGTQNGISAYVRARKLALDWNPQTCPPEK